jgi:RNA polymerase-interacting CarD/CdnL/TRCF family regulator
MKFKVNDRIKHPVYGLGTIVDSWPGRDRFSNKESENYAVRFDEGGPLGFATNATNDVKDLKAVKS